MDNCIKKLSEEEKKNLRNIKENLMEEKLERPKEKRDIKELKMEEKALNNHLETLRKENFLLQASIDSWQITLNQKLNQFKATESELVDLYKLIWSKRENFCTEADKFDEEFGVLSNWWKNQMEFVSDLDKLHEKRAEKKKNKHEMELLEKKVEGTKEAIEFLLKEKHSITTIYPTEGGEDSISRKEESGTMRLNNSSSNSISTNKKLKFASETDQVGIYTEEILTSENELYSMMDINKMKMANRRRNDAKKTSQGSL